jgi:hypothetical protein
MGTLKKEQRKVYPQKELREKSRMGNWYDDIDKRWEAIGCLVKKYGSYEDEMAWILCRGDAAEWRLATDEFKNRLKEFKPDSAGA